MEPMTRQESTDGCMGHWEFMAETGTKDKSAYPPAKGIKNHCYFCEYALVGTTLCTTGENHCPGMEYWSAKRTWGFCTDTTATGLSQTSLFIHWNNAKTKEERKLWASRIVWMIWLIGQDDLKGNTK